MNRLETVVLAALTSVIFWGCASKKIDYNKVEPRKNKEFEKAVKIQVPTPPPEIPISEAPQLKEALPGTPAVEGRRVQKRPAPPAPRPIRPTLILPRGPDLEDAEGFSGRRPLVDPFVVGERTVLDVRYLNMRAGTISFEVLPFATVNGRRTYHFRIVLRSTPSFEYIYSIDDMAETFVGFEDLLPLTHLVKIKESKQFGEIKSFFDWKGLRATKWESKYREGRGWREKKKEWPIEPFSQNVISAIFYLRNFNLTPGKAISYRVADDEDNLVMSATVLRREVLSTPLGDLNTVVLRPQVQLKGAFKPMGDIFIWMTDDSAKRIVQIQSKIRIGSIFAKVREMQ